jgi:drug/metabolite transporter (DMT)-like permease
MRLKADFALLLVAILWGSAFAAQRAAGQLGSVYFFNAARFLLAGLLLAPFAFRHTIARRQLAWSGIAGLILFIGSALQQAGLKTTSAGNAGFLTSLSVVIVPVVMLILWKDRPHRLSVLAIAVAAGGAYLLSTGGQYRAQTGDILELAGAAFWALHVVVLGKFASRYDAVAFSVAQLLAASGLSWVAGGILGEMISPPSSVLITAIVYTAVLSLGIGYTLQIWAQRHTQPTDAALILSLESVFAAISGAVLLKERLAMLQVLGCILIVLAVVISQVRGWSRIPRVPSTHTESDVEAAQGRSGTGVP